MGIGKIDPEYAVREGWARDSDDEIYMDGYNAFIQISTRDGTSGFQVKNDTGAVTFSSKSDGDGYVARDLDVGVKTSTLRLQVSEGAVNSWVLTSDAQGNATWQPIDASGLPAGTLDGYHPDSTGQEHYQQHSDAIQTILQSLDGYGGSSHPVFSDGYITFFTGETGTNVVAGDNDLFFNRVDNRLEVSAFKMSTSPTDGYILTSDASGVANWTSPSDASSITDPRGKSFNISCHRPGRAGNKWMYHETNSSATDNIPIHMAYDSSLVGISYMNIKTGTDVDLEFYVNGTSPGDLVYIEEIRDAKRHGHTVIGSFFDMVEGDQLSIFMKKLSSPKVPRHPVVDLAFVITTNNAVLFSGND